MVLPFAAFSGFNFDARELSIQSIDDTKDQSCENAEPDSTHHKRRSGATSDHQAGNRNLVGRDSCSAKARDDRGLDWRMNVRGDIERAVLCRIQNDAFSQTTVLCPRCTKTEWPDAPAHATDVIIHRRSIDIGDHAVVDFISELLKKRHTARTRQEELCCD